MGDLISPEVAPEGLQLPPVQEAERVAAPSQAL